MSYNVTVLDKSGHFATIYLAPDRAARVTFQPVCTNHQEIVEWYDYAAMTNTLARKDFMEQHLQNKGLTLQQQINAFLAPPLYHTNYEKYFGTLYTAVYNLKKNSLTLVWPHKTEEINFDNFKEKKIQVKLDKNVSNHLLK